jgi:menaquinone-dependent protoporphyrinogen IX oxidase
MKLLILYFSATGITGKIAKVIGETFVKMGGQVSMYDITPHANRQRTIDLKPYHAVVFGGSKLLMARVKNVPPSSPMAGLAFTRFIIPRDNC